VGMVFQHFNLLRSRSVLENVCFPLKLAGLARAAQVARARDVLELVGLTDFADKYRTPGIRLTPEAQDALMHYPWPGNIRQLKNIAEQIAVLEKERTVDADILAKYLPVERAVSGLPAIVRDAAKEDFSERDILYKVLFDMKKDMMDLKKLVVELIQNGVNPGTFEQNSPYIDRLYSEVGPAPAYIAEDAPPPAPTITIRSPNRPPNKPSADFAPYDAQEAQEVEESLSLLDKESDLIKKALKKYKGKRKAAARELGISERTLYRKIKDLNLDR